MTYIQIRVYSSQEDDFAEQQLDEISTLLGASSRSPYDEGTPQWHFYLEDVPKEVLLERIGRVLQSGYKVKHPAHISEDDWKPYAN